jgi:hypothetical protein
MNRRLKQAITVFIVVFAAAQFVRPERANPVTDTSHTIQADAGTASGLVAVLDRSCGDCHSNGTVWPWNTRVAPVSWLMAAGVKKGREVVNFSEWTAYDAATRHALLVKSCDAVSKGVMPGSAWTTLHPETRLSKQDIATICAAAHQEVP